MAEPDEEKRTFRLGWSAWRRAHQAVAKRCKKASRAAKCAFGTESTLEDRTTTKPKAATLLPEGAALLSNEEWEVLEPLIPPKPPAGRPYHDHRTVLGASCGCRAGVRLGGRCQKSSVSGRERTVATSYG
jgi:hypothetical protein